MKLELFRRPCPVCGNTDESAVFAEANFDPGKLDEYSFASRKIPEYMHYRMIACSTCDLIYASPIPLPDSLFEAYRDAAFDSHQEARYASRTYARFLLEIIRWLPDRHGVLDIGTGDGAFLQELLAAGFTGVQGVEPSVEPIQAAAPEVRPLIRQDIFRPEDFTPSSFSLITCFQTMEHLYDPAAVCRGVFELLRPGGVFFIIGHDWHALSAKLLGRKSPIFDIEHMQLFSRRSVRFMLDRAGFRDIRLRRVVNCYPLHYWLKLLPLPRGMKRRLITILRATRGGNIPLPLPAGNFAAIAFALHGETAE